MNSLPRGSGTVAPHLFYGVASSPTSDWSQAGHLALYKEEVYGIVYVRHGADDIDHFSKLH